VQMAYFWCRPDFWCKALAYIRKLMSGSTRYEVVLIASWDSFT
jgi:hypothetical protein